MDAIKLLMKSSGPSVEVFLKDESEIVKDLATLVINKSIIMKQLWKCHRGFCH